MSPFLYLEQLPISPCAVRARVKLGLLPHWHLENGKQAWFKVDVERAMKIFEDAYHEASKRGLFKRGRPRLELIARIAKELFGFELFANGGEK